MTSLLKPLLSPLGQEALARGERSAREQNLDISDATQAHKLSKELRSYGYTADLVSTVLTQLSLRIEAEKKFGRESAENMLFTRDGLEQATRDVVARLHAQRFTRANATSIADLGCGVGGDSRAFAQGGLNVIAIDKDPTVVDAARTNLAPYPRARVDVHDVLELTPKDFEAWNIDAIYADPARRVGQTSGSRRILDPEEWSPPLSRVLSWHQSVPHIGVKVAPGIAHDALPPSWHIQWMSVNGQLVEASLWSPSLSPEGAGRSACMIKEDGIYVLVDEHSTALGNASVPTEILPVGSIGSILAEPDPSVIRSGSLSTLGRIVGGHLLSENIAYLTGDHLHHSPFLTYFNILDVTALKTKEINRALAGLDIGRIEVKKRGSDIEPAALRKQLKLNPASRNSAVVFVTRVTGRHRAIIAQRISTIH